jgi:hypothetical protein
MKSGVRRKGIKWEYNGDGRFAEERYDAAAKRYWRRWKRRQGKKVVQAAKAKGDESAT